MSKKISIAASPNITLPNIPILDEDTFDAEIVEKGYNVIIEKAISCPCRGNLGTVRSSCNNCHGYGWVFVDPVKDFAVITSMNKSTTYKHWSPELSGTVNITVRQSQRLSFMDKVTILDNTSFITEVKPILYDPLQNNQAFIYATYHLINVNYIYLWNSDTTALIKVNSSNYYIDSANPYVLRFVKGFTFPSGFNGGVSIRYEYLEGYNIMDIINDYRTSKYAGYDGQTKKQNMPSLAIGRLSQYILTQPKTLSGNDVIDNSTI